MELHTGENGARSQPPRLRVALGMAVIFLTLTTLTVSAARAQGGGNRIDWGDPSQEVSFDGGWTAAVCVADGPMVCLERNGRARGIVEVGAFPVSTFTDADLAATNPQRFLRKLGREFLVDTADQRAAICAPDYVFDPVGPNRARAMGERGVMFGFSGRFADSRVSEITMIWLVIIDDHVVSINATGISTRSCEGGHGLLTIRGIRQFRRHLPALVRNLPEPTHLLHQPR